MGKFSLSFDHVQLVISVAYNIIIVNCVTMLIVSEDKIHKVKVEFNVTIFHSTIKSSLVMILNLIGSINVNYN